MNPLGAGGPEKPDRAAEERRGAAQVGLIATAMTELTDGDAS